MRGTKDVSGCFLSVFFTITDLITFKKFRQNTPKTDHITICFFHRDGSRNVFTALFLAVLFTFTWTNFDTSKLELLNNSLTAPFGRLYSHIVGDLGNTKMWIEHCYARQVVPLPVRKTFPCKLSSYLLPMWLEIKCGGFWVFLGDQIWKDIA